MKGRTMRKNNGFTLVEVAVVCAIVVILVSLVLPAIFQAKKGQLVRNAVAEIEFLSSALDQYKNDFGDYPPSFLADLGDSLAPDDAPNQGNKALVACLATGKATGPYLRSYMLSDDQKLKPTAVNADHNLTGWLFDDLRHRELLDPWDTPYIYLHNRDYESDPPPVYTMGGLMEDGSYDSPCTVKAQHDDDGVYYGTYTFQIWSCGPNRINDNGGEDDITSWQSQ
jgi:prepilin-type N-terminal cleavage/methylation domain-containing protein